MSMAQDDDSSTHAGPLQGIRVLDLGQYIAGPGAAMVLRELGATVTKVEPLAGDQARQIGRYGESMIRAYNRGKRSIALDLRSDAGRETAWRLIAQSDVVIQNLRPGAIERLGLGARAVRERFPRVVYLSITGFPARGPSRDRPGYDIAAQAESGLMSVTGQPDRPPQKVGVPIIDAAAAHLGAQAVLAALYGRERSGIGETLETSLFEVAMHLQATTWSDYLGGAPEPTRIGDGQPHNAPAAEVVPTRDGHIVLSAYADAHWARFCRVMGREELVRDARFATNALRVANRPALRTVLRECLSGLSSEECVEKLGRHQIVAGAVRSYAQVLAAPDFAQSGLLVDAAAPDGTRYRALGLPYRLGEAPRAAPPAAPACGADSDAVLAELGYDAAQIDALRRTGAVA
ncbi:crotonobetainyl-CoA:carnitine CoA-transferase CaiB-like acyl-CoA transferase [Variovorax sp. TBS-050B]|uniref:CaiB/BaiF CoA transferase family protein n=1 Tax=Variovorax sp. TBS-050B TaxID=2940551 RepID=UPI0024749F9F|nr:CoA transferase [Variovorax sp. TBS-050B]MDH6590559.1 crotonobetainyl-CoA:carnitine CoA-transferase CaiB-like acyl-CoA transferase [Variovorax sp. TBS-050B]